MSMSVYWIHHPSHTDMFTQGYIGITKNFKERMRFHKMLRCNAYLSNAIKKYGWDNLIKEVVLVADKDYCISIETKLRSKDSIGWNLVKGGGLPPINRWNKGTKGLMTAWNKGKTLSEEQKKQISNSVKQLWKNNKYRQHMSDVHKGKECPMKGKKHSAESIAKMKISHAGIPSKRKGIAISDETRQKLLNTMASQSWECPHCNKTGKGIHTANRWHFNNCKLKGIQI
jgi:group I intron endonuclease